MDVDDLYGTTDAMAWAEVFCRMVTEKPEIATDPGTMVGWFANAMGAQEAAVGLPARTTRDLLDELEKRTPERLHGPLHTFRAQVGPSFLDKNYIENFLAENADA